MAASTFLTGEQAASPPPPPPLATSPRLTLADALRLLRTPSSEGGVLAYHRALEGAAPPPEVLLAELSALREGRSTRFELLTEIALSPKARSRGVGGVGLLAIRVVRKAFVASGAASRVRARRAVAAQAEAAARASGATPTVPADVTRKLVMLEGAVLRLENQAFAEARRTDPAVAALEARVAALEAELRTRLLEEAAAQGSRTG